MKTHPVTSRTLRLLGALGAFGLAGSLASADVSVHVDLGGPPPAPRVERYSMRDRPGPDYVWVDGYWGGSPGHYEWVGGHWDRPSHRGARWIAPRWEHRDGRYVFVKGYWR